MHDYTIIECAYCHKKISARKDHVQDGQKYCSQKCWGAVVYHQNLATRNCLHCHQPFTLSTYLPKRYCSNTCSGLNHRKRIQSICAQCGIAFEMWPSYQKRGGKYCSQSCVHKSRLKPIERICVICQKKFITQPNVVARGGATCCSHECRMEQIHRSNRIESWSTKYAFCQQCGETSASYASHGLCTRCVQYNYYHTERGLRADKNTKYMVKFGITYDDREWMSKMQDNRCAICGEKENGKKLAIDHNHKTKQVRMLLCGGCNHGTKLTDRPDLLQAKLEYLKSFST